MYKYRFRINICYQKDDNIVEESIIVLANTLEEALYYTQRALHLTEFVMTDYQQYPKNIVPPTAGEFDEHNS